MSDKINDGGPAVCRCGSVAVIRQGNSRLCERHYRFHGMRTRAKRDGKSVPSVAELETLAAALDTMNCPSCSRRMNWRQRDGASTVVTLQHDRAGGTRLLCLACNTRHAQMPGDSFYELPPGHRRCNDCARTMAADNFPRDNGRAGGRRGYCKGCANARHAEWVKRNREHVNSKQRERRHASG